jgi:hypothetical protein
MKESLKTGSITLEGKEYESFFKVVQYLLDNEETSFEESGRAYGHIYRDALRLELAIKT